MKSALYYIAFLSTVDNLESAAVLRTTKSSKRDLQSTLGVETCAWTPIWRFANDPLYDRNPIIPCTSHLQCAGFSGKGVSDRWPPCCLNHDCVCGSTRILFQSTGSHSCARFACSADSECAPGFCRNSLCNFDNIDPECRTGIDCGGGVNDVCYEGLCHVKDPATGFLLLVKHDQNKGAKTNNSGSKGDGKVEPLDEGGSEGKNNKPNNDKKGVKGKKGSMI